ncbi:MAG: malonate decarboxylase subunit delta, partial [Verrucomicrobia bacterium]|nr:malonate decarboxylase subunit delta [Verrucomicrobiota bacterium]
ATAVPPMEKLIFNYPASVDTVPRRAHVGVVASGDMEVLLEPSASPGARVIVNTSVDGYRRTWKGVLDRFFSHYHGAAAIEINDFGATPGTVLLRLEQAAEKSRT